MKRGEVISEIKKANFKDTSNQAEMTAPTKLFPTETDAPILRLDYAFYRGNLKIKNFKVSTQNIFNKSSDHYPISFDCSLS